MNIAIILAGGIGSRVGDRIPKQFIKVLGKPVLAYTIETFERNDDIDSILVVCLKEYINYIWDIKEKYKFSKVKWVTSGGNTFQESVSNGINYLEGKIGKEDIVVIHFGASPFVNDEIICDSIRVCKEKGNAISTTDYYLLSGKKKTNDTVLEAGNCSTEYINRDTIAVMNTPHSFKYEFICNLFKEAISSGIFNDVEPHTTSLMYSMGKTIFFSKGSQTNIKITNKEDLCFFEKFIIGNHKTRQRIEKCDAIVLLADGFEEGEGLLIVDILRRANLKVVMVSIMNRIDVVSSRGILVSADCLDGDVNYESARIIILPGGRDGVEKLESSEVVRGKLPLFAKDKMIGAICAAPLILERLNLLKGKRVTIHPDFKELIPEDKYSNDPITISGNIITGQGLGLTIPFALTLVKQLVGKKTADDISNAICFEY